MRKIPLSVRWVQVLKSSVRGLDELRGESCGLGLIVIFEGVGLLCGDIPSCEKGFEVDDEEVCERTGAAVVGDGSFSCACGEAVTGGAGTGVDAG